MRHRDRYHGFASEDPEANIDRIMMSFVKVFDERGHCWAPGRFPHVAVHGQARRASGEGGKSKRGEGFGVALGDRVVFLAEDRIYGGPKGMRRHGVGNWSILSSRLMFGISGKKGTRIREVPRKVVNDGYLIYLSKRGDQVGLTFVNNSEWQDCQERCRAAAEKEPWSQTAYLEQNRHPLRR